MLEDNSFQNPAQTSESLSETANCPFDHEKLQAKDKFAEHTTNSGIVLPVCSLPTLLQTQLFWHRHNQFLTFCRKRYGPTFALKILPWRRLVVVSSVDDVKSIFTGDAKVFHAGDGNRPLAPVLGKNSVIVIDEDEHLQKRKQMLPPFHGKAVKKYEETIRKVAETEVQSWPYDKSFSLHPKMRKITLEVILRAVMGVEDPKLLETMREVLPLTVELPAHITLMWIWPGLARFGPWKRYTENLALANKLLLEEVKHRRTEVDISEREDILSLLIRDTEMEDEDLKDQLMTMLLAGHETTTTALSWALERLVRHPEIMQKAKAGDDEYMDAVIKETLRIRPVIPGVLRDLTEDVVLGGYQIKKGDTLFPADALIHRQAELYKNPEEFRPERFLEGEGGTYEWIPFGGGRRRCLGAAFANMEMRICLRIILEQANLFPEKAKSENERNFHITIVPHRGAKVVRRH
jgi:cytochrome P450